VQHDWPGNVRELKAVVECAIALSDRESVSRADCLRASSLSCEKRQMVNSRGDFAARRLLEVLEQTAWDVGAAAVMLGVHRATVYRRLSRMQGVSLPSPSGAGHRRSLFEEGSACELAE